MSLDLLLSGLDMPTLFVVRAFTQVVLASAVVGITIRSGWRPALTWLAASMANACGWMLLPLGLAHDTMLLPAASTGLIILAALLHMKAISIHVEFRLPWLVVLVPPLLSSLVVVWLELPAVPAGTFMCLVAGGAMLLGALALRRRLGQWARPETFAVLMFATAINFVAALARGIAGLAWPLAFAMGEPATTQVILPYLGTVVGMIALNLAFVSLIKDRGERALELLALQDSLTSLWNRRGLEETAWRIAGRAVAGGRDVSVVVLDIDHFKATNDRWGHAFGDQALIRFANAMQQNCRAGDFAMRIGGEEFCLVLLDTDVHEAMALVDRLRVQLLQDPFLPDATPLRFSAGIAPVQVDDHEPNRVLSRADAALYAAKTNGRSRSEVALRLSAWHSKQVVSESEMATVFPGRELRHDDHELQELAAKA